MTPDEYLRTHPSSRGVLYYPGCGSDYGPLRLFVENGAIKTAIYTDYTIESPPLGKLFEKENGWKHTLVEKLTCENLQAESWVDFWPNNSSSRRFASPHRARAFQTKFQSPNDASIQFIFCKTEGVQTLPCLIRAGLTPTIIVLQDHGFGCNWTSFGGNNQMYHLAQHMDALPELLFVARNTIPWTGYARVSEYVFYEGQMHHHKRALYRKNPLKTFA